MVKLLVVAPTCDANDVGEAWVAHQWVRRLAERHDVTVLTYHKRGAEPAADQLPGVRVVEWTEPPILGRFERLNSIAKPGYVPFYFRARQWIRKAIAGGARFDLAHQPTPVAIRYPSPLVDLGVPFVMGPVGGGLASPTGFAADEGAQPWYMALRGIDDYRRRWDPLLRRTFAAADCVLGVASYVQATLAGMPMQRFEIMSETGLERIPDPVDRSGRDGPVRLLFVGRLVRTKGVRDIIRALGALTDVAVRLDVVGEGPERATCEGLVASLGLQDRVTLHGWRSKDEVAGFYRAADLFVFPSYREPGGNVALEAMSWSLPLIVVGRGGPGSATTDDCAVRLPVSDPATLATDLARTIRLLATNAPLRLRMGRAGREHVARTALWSSKLDRMDVIYQQILTRPSALSA